MSDQVKRRRADWREQRLLEAERLAISLIVRRRPHLDRPRRAGHLVEDHEFANVPPMPTPTVCMLSWLVKIRVAPVRKTDQLVNRYKR